MQKSSATFKEVWPVISMFGERYWHCPEYHEKIFGFFKRLHNNSKYEGTGIGLGNCNKIVHKMGGEILIESEVGKGGKFTVLLPFEEVVENKGSSRNPVKRKKQIER